MFEDEVEAVLGEGLLFNTDAELEHVLKSLLPGFVMFDEGVVFEGVAGTFDVLFFEGMGGVHEVVVEDVLGGDPEVMGLGDAEVAVDVGGLTGTNFKGAVDVAVTVGIAVGKGEDGEVLVVGEAADKPSAGPGGDAAHGDEDAVGFLEVAMVDKALEQGGGFDDEDKLGFALEAEMLDAGGDAPGAGAELEAVDGDVLAGGGILVDDGDGSANVAATLFGDVAELFAIDAEHSLDVVEEGVAFGLLVEPAFAPAFRVVIDFAFACDVVLVEEVILGGGEQSHGLGEGLDGVVGEGAGGDLVEDLEVAALDVVFHVGQGTDGEGHRGLLALFDDVVANGLSGVHDFAGGGLFGDDVWGGFGCFHVFFFQRKGAKEREGTQRGEGKNLMSIHDTMDSIFKVCFAKIDDQAEFLLG